MADVVYVYGTAQNEGEGRKLLSPWKGPGVIIEELSPILFKVRLSNRELVANHHRIKLCRDRSHPKWVERFRAKPKQGFNIPGLDEYCICRGSYNSHFVFRCNECEEWFQGTCICGSKQEAEGLDKYFCPLCSGN